MLTEVQPKIAAMDGEVEDHSRKPGGVRIFGWVSVFFCGLLAFLNASLATDVSFRVFFIVIGSILILGGTATVLRWYRRVKAR